MWVDNRAIIVGWDADHSLTDTGEEHIEVVFSLEQVCVGVWEGDK